MLDLKIKWSDPYSYKTEYGIWWKRDWLIEKEYLSLFFNYWRQNSFKLKDKGYGVTKKDEGWYLYETKPEKHLFKEIVSKYMRACTDQLKQHGIRKDLPLMQPNIFDGDNGSL